MKEIKIYSLTQFYHVIRSPAFDQLHTAAIICSSYPVEGDWLSGVRYIACQYDDIDYDVLGRCFTLVEAKRIVRFLKSCDSKVTTICCICDGGCRRSAAVAAALFRFYGREDEELNKVWKDSAYEPNPLVYRLLSHALGVPADDSDIDLRIWENRNACCK